MSQQPTSSNGDDRTPEEVFIGRMKRERERRGWSQAALATRVSERPKRIFSYAGWLHATAVTKLEYALQPRRRKEARNLRLNEAIVIAETFGLTLPAMLSDDDLTDAGQEAENLKRDFIAAQARRIEADREADIARMETYELVQRLEQLLGPDGLRSFQASVESAAIDDWYRNQYLRSEQAERDAAEAVERYEQEGD